MKKLRYRKIDHGILYSVAYIENIAKKEVYIQYSDNTKILQEFITECRQLGLKVYDGITMIRID